MNVGELIKILKTLHPTVEVLVGGDDGYRFLSDIEMGITEKDFPMFISISEIPNRPGCINDHVVNAVRLSGD